MFEDGVIVVMGGAAGRVVLYRNNRGHDEQGIFPPATVPAGRPCGPPSSANGRAGRPPTSEHSAFTACAVPTAVALRPGLQGNLGDPPGVRAVRLLRSAGECLVRSGYPRQPARPGVRLGVRRVVPRAGHGNDGRRGRCRARRRPSGHRRGRGCRGCSCCCRYLGRQPNGLTPTLCSAWRTSDLSWRGPPPRRAQRRGGRPGARLKRRIPAGPAG